MRLPLWKKQTVFLFQYLTHENFILRKNLGKEVYFDAHMMVSAPETWVESMAASGTDIYTFHVEATEDPKKTIRIIKEAGMKAGIGIKVR